MDRVTLETRAYHRKLDKSQSLFEHIQSHIHHPWEECDGECVDCKEINTAFNCPYCEE